MARDTTEPTLNERGDEVHPAFGMISAVRASYSGDGQVLFQSDIKHGHTIRISVSGATRKRDLHHDWVHDDARPLIEVELSEAQWASFVSSMNTTGVPCTIRRTETDWNIPGLVYDPRLAHSMNEVRGAADKTFAKIRDALADYENAVAEKAGAKVLREKLRSLHYTVENTEGNLAFAAKSLTEHAENVVQKARADIEAMVGAEAQRLGLTAGEAKHLLELPAMPGEESEP
jgi:hypothetical protein